MEFTDKVFIFTQRFSIICPEVILKHQLNMLGLKISLAVGYGGTYKVISKCV